MAAVLANRVHLQGESGFAVVIRSAISLGMVRLGGLALGLAMNIVAARALGPAGYGGLAFLLSLVTLFSAISSGGLTPLLTRDVAADAESGSPVIVWIMCCAALVATGFLFFRDAPTAFWVFAALIGLGLLAVFAGVLRGLGHSSAGDLPLAVVIPAVFLSLVMLAPLFAGSDGSNHTGDPISFFAVYVVAIWIAVIIGWMLLWSYRRRDGVSRSISLAVSARGGLSWSWIRGFWPFLSLALVGALATQLGTVMVGWFADETTTAFYRVAERLAVLVSLPLVVLNAVSAPRVVRLHAAGDASAIMDLVRRTRFVAIAVSLPVVAVLVFFGSDVIDFLFGNQYGDGARTALLILLLGQFINVACGSVGLVLSMCGHERTVLREQAMAMCLSLLLLPIAIVLAGAEGAAVVMTAVLAMWNLRLLGVLRKWIPVRSSAAT